MRTSAIPALGSALMALTAPVHAYDVNDRLSIGGVMAGVYQCQRLSEKAGANNTCDYAVPLQPELSFRPTDRDEFSAKAGFANGNGLNGKSPFVLAPWAAWLHDDVKDINGSNRDYLLTAWYRHTFTLAAGSTLDASAGLIDATDYLDENAYANDEYTQFMNEALVNGPNAFLPSYDKGAALGWSAGRWSLHGVAMRVNRNDDGNAFTFYGAQVGYALQSGLGEGNYRVLIDRTSHDFVDGNGNSAHKRASMLFSFDQPLGGVVGAFLRFGWRFDDAAVNYDGIWSGGVDIKGGPWHRPDDNIGLGYAYLSGGDQQVSQSQVAEGYYRFVLNSCLALSADVQYMKDEQRNEDNPQGFIFGLRLTAEF
jgi:hypothetical protein